MNGILLALSHCLKVLNLRIWTIIDQFLFSRQPQRSWLERAVRIQLYSFLSSSQIPYYCGFRTGHPTEFVVISFTDSIRRNVNKGFLRWSYTQRIHFSTFKNVCKVVSRQCSKSNLNYENHLLN